MAEIGNVVLVRTRPSVRVTAIRNLIGTVARIRTDAGRAAEKQVLVDLTPLRGGGEWYWVDDVDVLLQ